MTRTDSPARPDRFVLAARFVGDFGNPFYDEERQRDVWNEASAFGLQLLLWSVLLAATVTLWVVGAPAVPYAIGALALLGVVCLLTTAYASRLGVSVMGQQRMLRLRLLPYGALVLVLAGGFVRASDSEVSPSSAVGFLMGATVAVGCFVLAVRRARRPGPEGG